MINNPYIEKVKNHPKIFTELETEIYPHKWKWGSFFANKNPIVLEIWTGLWNYFSKIVNQNLNKNFIWIELKYKRCFVTAQKCLWEKRNNDNSVDNTKLKKYNKNFVILKVDAKNIDKIFDKEELDEIIIFFPDPWAKKSSWLKRRLLSVEYLNILYKISKKNAKLYFKTDHLGYFLNVLYNLEKTPWKVIYKTFDYEKEGLFEKNSITEFEQIFRWQNIKVCYLELQK